MVVYIEGKTEKMPLKIQIQHEAKVRSFGWRIDWDHTMDPKSF